MWIVAKTETCLGIILQTVLLMFEIICLIVFRDTKLITKFKRRP